MELLLNDLSIHEQFPDVPTFREAIHRVMSLRHLASNYGRALYAHRNVVNSRINARTSLHDALQTFQRDEKRSFLQWLTRQGPFWEDAAQHNPDQWMDCGDEIVTDTAVGEAAYCMTVGINRSVVSFVPSRWNFSPIVVGIGPGVANHVVVANYWRLPELEAALQAAEPPIASWQQLESVSRARYQRLTFSADCFGYLNGQPFAPGAAAHILSRFDVLDRLMNSVDASGQRTAEGHQLYQDHFTGDRAWFSDSSDSEKREFERALTFPNPELSGGHLFCTWHGKVNSPPFRIHFAWPERLRGPLYVVYVGLKITRR